MIISLIAAALLQTAPVQPPVAWSTPPRIEMPPKALESGASGKVVLRCVIIDGGAVSSCVVVSETPAGQGFGREALRGIRTARAQPGQEGTREITLIFATH